MCFYDFLGRCMYHEATKKAIKAGVNAMLKTTSQMIKKDPQKLGWC
jgi:hypothetical protein